ncbi:hypothetical protein MMUC44124_00910 [Mycolicibacterium mucogenicum DSM 44124]|uniref:Portal protein n=1 Tax=Mycolicibacterium mucogenicum DSM 44124 TaxID=1226753 RepID=A0A8H2JAP6_MYCMU|nr:hypothetical protein MMUC44124_00910 [Mycolicibacterium mucogenicum DSM 44124]
MARRALTAASAPVTDVNQLFKSGIGGARKQWQDEAWEHYRCVGELRYYVGWRANSCSRIRFVASEIGDDGLPTGSIDEKNTEGQRFAEIVKSIAGGALGQSQLVKRATEQLTVPGEHWIAILMQPEGGWADGSPLLERWFVVTHREIERGQRDGEALIKLPDGSKHKFDHEKGDGIFRVWNPDAEDATLPSSPVQAVLDPLREIRRSTRKIANTDDSRLINNGILVIPSEASLPDTQAPVSADKPGEPPAPPQPKRKVAGQLQQMIFDVATASSEEGPGSMASLAPIVITAPGDQIKNIAHIQFGKDLQAETLTTRDKAITRLAMGLEISPERLFGMGGSNHWSAWIVADEDVQQHLAPAMVTICQAIYDSVLRNVLASEGIDPSKYCLWYDASHLTADPDLTDEAKDANDRGAFTNEALVRQLKLPADGMYELDTLEGWQQWAQDQVSKKPELITTLLPLLDKSLQAIDFPQPAPPPAIDQAPPPADSTVPQSEPGTEDTSQEAAVRESTDFAVDLLVDRALELAGKRRRTRADFDRLQSIPMHATHRVMGPVRREQVPDLIKGWDSSLDELTNRYGIDPAGIRAAVRRRVERELTMPLIDAEVVG